MKPSHDRSFSIAEGTPSNSISRHTPSAVPKTLIAFATAGILSTAAHAQQAPTTSADDSAKPQIEEVVITGSMIKRVDAETAEAITILKADTLKDQGITNLEQMMNSLTSANPSVNVAQSVGTFS